MPDKRESNMKKSIEQKIVDAVNYAKTIKNSKINYNFELPKMEGVKKDDFMGIQAEFNNAIPKNELSITYTYG